MKHLEYLIVGMLVIVLVVGSFIFIPYAIGTGLSRIKFVKEFESSSVDPTGIRWWIGFVTIGALAVSYAGGRLLFS